MDDRGWKPILRKHGGNGRRNSVSDNEIHTIFVDNLPESMDPKGLYNIFTNYGIVKDVFIPNKRRKLTRSRFGFVRYACPVAADMAIQKAHGIWCDNRALKVKIADFGQGKVENQQALITPDGRRGIVTTSRVPSMVQKGKSYAQVLGGQGLISNSSISIQVNEEGNGWLYESVIVRLKPQHLVVEFEEELKNRGLGDVQIRVGGGRDIVLTFQTAGIMSEKLKALEGWIQSWSESVKVWQKGMVLDQERFVWLTCYGVPLNLWNCKTFSNIGRSWGEVIGIDEDTSRMRSFQSGKVRIATKCMESINTTITLRCKGVDYPVKVCEDQVVISEVVYKQCKCYSVQPQPENSNSNSVEQDQEQQSAVGSKKDEDEADVEGHVGGVLDSRGAEVEGGPMVKHDEHIATNGRNRVLSVSRVEETIMSTRQSDCLQKQLGGEGKARGAQPTNSLQNSSPVQNEGNQNSADEIATTGFMRSLSGPQKDVPGLNIEVLLSKAHVIECGNTVGHRLSELSDPMDQPTQVGSGQISMGKEIQVRGDKESHGGTKCNSAVVDHKRKNIIKEKPSGMAKYQRKKKGNLQIGVDSVLNFRKGAIFRSAAAAISLSMSSKSGSGHLLLNEAEASLQIGKVLGLQCKGKEEEVLGKLMELEAKDKEVLGKRGTKGR
ncbi:unnamed protein product [Camellia sinensis]